MQETKRPHVAKVQIAPIISTRTSTPIFHDEFLRDGSIDLNKWEFLEGTGENGWGTHQQQYYTRNAHCEGNRLIIEARKEIHKESRYTSARLRSKQTFLYGKLEIRAKLPSAKGTWSSFVLLPAKRTYGSAMWPENGEINLVSLLGSNPTMIRSSVCTKSNNPLRDNIPINMAEVPDANTQFKTYTLLWSPDQIEMFVRLNDTDSYDRRILLWEKLNRDWTFWPFDQRFHLEIYLGVGGDVAGNEIDDDKFPQQLEIASVRFEEWNI
ncbi:unnamed protein product [Adineta steineri]|uniref:GH16 domain-containing protein n=2 Tax=Adineta steineri TaxID=433720 RepID=A0A815TJM5_9BILA|nr:unnamed protein product [Adineta steineri]